MLVYGSWHEYPLIFTLQTFPSIPSQLAIRASKKGPRPGTVLNCTRPAPPPNVKFYPFAFYSRLLYGFEVPVASAVSVMAAGFADQCYSACG